MFARLLALPSRAQWQSRLVLIKPMAPPNLFTQLEFFGSKAGATSRDRSRSPGKKHWREAPRKDIEGLPRRAGGSQSEFGSSQSGRGAPRGRGGMQRGGRGSFGRGQPFASRGRGGVHRGGRGSFAGSREDGGRGEFKSPRRQTFDDDGSGSDGGGYTSQRSHGEQRDRPSFRGGPRGRGGMNRGGRGSFAGGRDDRGRGEFRSPHRQTFDDDDGSGSDGGEFTSKRSHGEQRDRPSFRGGMNRGRGGMNRGGRGSFAGGRDDRGRGEFRSPRRQTFDENDDDGSGSDGGEFTSQRSHSEQRDRPSFRGAPRGRGGMNRGGRGSFAGGGRGEFKSPRRQTFDDQSGSDGGEFTSQRSRGQERDRPSFRGGMNRGRGGMNRGRGGMHRGGRGSFAGGRDDRGRGEFRSPRRQTFDEDGDESDRHTKRGERRTKSADAAVDVDDAVPSPALGKTGNKLKFIPSEVAEAITSSLQNVENQEPLRSFNISPPAPASDVSVSQNDTSSSSGGGGRRRQNKPAPSHTETK